MNPHVHCGDCGFIHTGPCPVPVPEKEPALTSRQITDILCRCHWRPRQHVLVPNVSWGLLAWEADLVVMFKSGWMEEVEIKISRGDFKREFEKKPEKHERLVRGLPKMQWLGHSVEPNWSNPKPHQIRRYWMAMPHDLAESVLADVPSYAGVIAVRARKVSLPESGFGDCRVLRKAPILPNARKLEPDEQRQLLRLGHLRYWDLRRQQGSRV